MPNSETTNYTNWRNNTLIAKMETDKKYAVLKMGSYLTATAGLGWYILYTLTGIRFAIENGYIPVIDWKNCKIPQYASDKVGEENVWEYFFEQPYGIGVEEAYKSNNFFVIDDVRQVPLTKGIPIEKMEDFYNEDVVVWRDYFQQYIRIKKEILELFEQNAKKQFKNHRNLIGVLARGTDYKELKPVGHLKLAGDEEFFGQIDKLIAKENDSKIFLATEDVTILKKFEARYPEKVFSVKAKRYQHLGHNTLNVIYKQENGYERDLKYLYSLYILSKCPMGIYSACGGGAIVSLMKKEAGFSYSFLYRGYNKAKAIIVGSRLEREQDKIIFMGSKPILFYALNTLKLIGIEEADVIISQSLKIKYGELLGCGKAFGMRINYVESGNYNVLDYMKQNSDFMAASKLVLLYADYFVHGKDVVKEVRLKLNEFDGACVWGVKNFFTNENDSINVDEVGIPRKAFKFYRQGNYSLMGKFIFDYELPDIISGLSCKKEITIVDVLNEYINRKKLFFYKYNRGIVYSYVNDMKMLTQTSQMIELIERIQEQKIGDFGAFKLIEK